jgi:predicted transcriptional regulator
MEQPSLGDQELEVLRFVAEHAPISVGEVAERFGEPRGLARTTILTVMERLRKKGFLTRSQGERPFRYSPRTPQGEVLRGLVREFVEKTLGGSLSPFVAYLAEAKDVSSAELRELRRLVEELDTRAPAPRASEEKGDDV